MQEFTAKLVKKTQLTHKIYELEFKLIEPEKISFRPGQFMMVELPGGKTRAYSIASSPSLTDRVQFLVDVSPMGPASKFFLELKIGTQVKFYGPLGEFRLQINQQQDFVFIATGSGIAPIKSMIAHLHQRHQAGLPLSSVTLYFGLRYRKDIFNFDKYQQLENDWPVFKFLPTLSQPEDGWSGRVGRVSKWLAEDELPESADYYICGNVPMAKEVSQTLIDRDVAPKNIHQEAWGV